MLFRSHLHSHIQLQNFTFTLTMSAFVGLNGSRGFPCVPFPKPQIPVQPVQVFNENAKWTNPCCEVCVAERSWPISTVLTARKGSDDFSWEPERVWDVIGPLGFWAPMAVRSHFSVHFQLEERVSITDNQGIEIHAKSYATEWMIIDRFVAQGYKLPRVRFKGTHELRGRLIVRVSGMLHPVMDGGLARRPSLQAEAGEKALKRFVFDDESSVVDGASTVGVFTPDTDGTPVLGASGAPLEDLDLLDLAIDGRRIQ